MYGSSSYCGGTDVLSLLFSAGGAWVALSFVAFVAAIVCAVLLYKKFVSGSDTPRFNGKKHDFGPFLRFERFWSEKILIALFIYNMCLIAFESVAAVVSLLFVIAYSPAGVLLGFVIIALVFVVSEVLNRLFYEFVMLIVKMWRNTQEIRTCLENRSSMQSSKQHEAERGAVSAGTPHAQSPYATPMQSNAAVYVQADSAGSTQSWVCPSCGAMNRQGVFCAQCGKKRE